MSDARPLDCDELVELVTDYFEGALPAPDRTRFEEHLGDCPGCVTYVDQMRLTTTALGRLCEEDVPSDARALLLAAFRDWKSRP
jgi:anti-sigma factor (TIGR02949 family)